MKVRAIFAAMVALFLATGAQAQDISPGLWQLTIETRVSAIPGFVPAPYTLNQCFTAGDARDPSRVLVGIGNPGASDCTYTDIAYRGNTFHFSMRCAGSFGISTTGEVSFTATTLDGTITVIADVGGQKTEFSNRISGKRIGGC
jgi:Protein of unknown function (DUF3617)